MEGIRFKRIICRNVHRFPKNTVTVRKITVAGGIVGNIQNCRKGTDDPIGSIVIQSGCFLQEDEKLIAAGKEWIPLQGSRRTAVLQQCKCSRNITLIEFEYRGLVICLVNLHIFADPVSNFDSRNSISGCKSGGKGILCI